MTSAIFAVLPKKSKSRPISVNKVIYRSEGDATNVVCRCPESLIIVLIKGLVQVVAQAIIRLFKVVTTESVRGMR